MEARLTPILHALPYALRGVSTAEIPFNAVGQIVLPSSVPLALATVLQSICEPCVLYRALDTSLKRYNPHGLLMQALFSSIRESLRSYLAFTSEIETQCMQPGFNLAAAQSVLLEPCIYLRLFHYILKQCTSNRNIHVLSIVWEFTNHGDPLVASYAQELFLAVNEPFERIKQEWENLGSLQLDLFDEFYVSQVGNEKRLTLIDRKIPIGVMSTEEIERSFQRGVAMYFIREVCGDLEFFGTGKTFAQIVEHSRQMLVENNQLMLHLRGLRDYMLLANGDFVDSLFRNDPSNFLMRPVVDVPNYQASEFFLTAIGDTKQVEEDPLISGAVDAKVLGIDKGAAGIQLWEALVGIYHIDSKPISRVVDAGAMEIYERCFALLWRVRFSVQSLNRSSGYLRNLAREIQLDHADFNALLNMHAEMTQTFLTLQTRLYYNVIEKEWLALHDLIHKPETLTIVQIKQAHEAYLGEIAAVAGNPAHFRIIDASTKEALALESTLDRLLVGNELNEFKSDLDHLKASVYPTIVKLMQLM